MGKHCLIIGFLLLFCNLHVALAQNTYIFLDEKSFAPVNVDVLTGLAIDKIRKDRSNRPCSRVKIHITRMLKEDIEQLQVIPRGGNVMIASCIVAQEGNGLIFEITAAPIIRFHLFHPRLGESNVVTINVEPNKEYYMEAWGARLVPITVASNVAGADVYVDNEYHGVTSLAHKVLNIPEMPMGDHELRVSADGETNVQRISVSDSLTYFYARLTEVGQFDFVSEPSGATISIDGGIIGQTPIYSYPLSAKPHKVTARKGEVEDTREIDFASAAKTIAFDVRDYAVLNVRLSGKGVSNGTVSLDGAEPKTVPFRTEAELGHHKLKVFGYKGRVEEHDIQVVKGKNEFTFPYPGSKAMAAHLWWKKDGVVSVIPLMTYSSSTIGYGGMIVLNSAVFGSRYGTPFLNPYVKFTSTFTKLNIGEPLDNQAFHSFEDGSFHNSSLSGTAGIMFNFTRFSGPYVGFGYGARRYFEKAQGQLWYNSDHDYRNCDLDIGYIARVGRFKLMAGITVPSNNLWYGLYNIGNYSWDYLWHMVKGAWRSAAYVLTMGYIFDPIDNGLGSSDYQDFLNKFAPLPGNPIEKSKQKTWKWFPYNFVEFNVGVGFTF